MRLNGCRNPFRRSAEAFALVAQWIERVPTKFLVGGSNPSERTTHFTTACFKPST